MMHKSGTYWKFLFISCFFVLLLGNRQLVHAELQIYYMHGGPAFFDRSLWVMDADGNSKKLYLEPPIPMIAPKISQDGKRILFTTLPRDHDVWGVPKFKLMVMNRNGSGLQDLIVNSPHPGSGWGMWSPDGRQIVYQTFKPERPIQFELYVADADGHNSFQVASNIDVGISAAEWFPDSQRIAFSISKPNFSQELYMVDASPNARAVSMKILLRSQGSISWSLDGKRSIVRGQTNAREPYDLFLGNAVGRNLVRLTQDVADQSGAIWLPDGEHIVFGTDSDQPDVAVMNVETKTVRRLTDDGRSIFAFWYDPALTVNAAGKLATSWGKIKHQSVPD